MSKLILLILLFPFTQLLSNNNWVKVYTFDGFEIEHVEAFSKDTFLVATHFNKRRNGNITFEYALQMTTDIGKSWKMIYQDSTSLDDIPKEAQRIVDLKTTESSIITLLRKDGYILYSKDFGNKWDSVKTSYDYNNVGLIERFHNKILAYYKYTDSLFIFDLDSKKLETIYFPRPVFDGVNEDYLNLTAFSMLSDNYFIFSANRNTYDTNYSYSYISEDRGKTWKLYDRPNVARGYYFINNKLGYSCGDINKTTNPAKPYYSSIDKTTDGGKTWSNIYKGEEYVSFRQITKRGNSFVCLDLNSFYPRSSDNLTDWEVDSVNNDKSNDAIPYDIDCDNVGNCIFANRFNYIQRILSSKSSVTIIPFEDYEYNYEYYDLYGKKIENIRGDSDLPNGLYLKVYLNKNNKIEKTKKLLITN